MANMPQGRELEQRIQAYNEGEGKRTGKRIELERKTNVFGLMPDRLVPVMRDVEEYASMYPEKSLRPKRIKSPYVDKAGNVSRVNLGMEALSRIVPSQQKRQMLLEVTTTPPEDLSEEEKAVYMALRTSIVAEALNKARIPTLALESQAKNLKDALGHLSRVIASSYLIEGAEMKSVVREDGKEHRVQLGIPISTVIAALSLYGSNRYNRSKTLDNFKPDMPKCNKFVGDMLISAGIPFELLHREWGKGPYRKPTKPANSAKDYKPWAASDWHDWLTVIHGFDIVPFKEVQIGDIMSSGEHVGIVIAPGLVISAGGFDYNDDKKILEYEKYILITDWGFRNNGEGITVRHYTGSWLFPSP